MKDIYVNKILLVGEVLEEFEVQSTQHGTEFAQVRVVTKEQYVDREGLMQISNTRHNVKLWGWLCKGARGLAPGDMVLVEGKIVNRSYEDQYGTTKWITEIKAAKFTALPDNANPDGNDGATKPQQQQGSRNKTRVSYEPKTRSMQSQTEALYGPPKEKKEESAIKDPMDDLPF